MGIKSKIYLVYSPVVVDTNTPMRWRKQQRLTIVCEHKQSIVITSLALFDVKVICSQDLPNRRVREKKTETRERRRFTKNRE